jgi:hypothetical protein
MDSRVSERNEAQVSLDPVTRDNWRAIANLEVSETQRESVAKPCF